MKKIKHDPVEFVLDANSVEGSLKVLSTFIFYKLSSENDVTREDLGALDGIVKSIQTLASKHANEMAEYVDSL